MEKLEDRASSYDGYKVNELKKRLNSNLAMFGFDAAVAGLDAGWGFDHAVQGRYGWAAFFFGFGALMALMGRSRYKGVKKQANELEALALENSERQY